MLDNVTDVNFCKLACNDCSDMSYVPVVLVAAEYVVTPYDAFDIKLTIDIAVAIDFSKVSDSDILYCSSIGLLVDTIEKFPFLSTFLYRV